MTKVKTARITPKKGGITYFTGFVAEVLLAESEKTELELGLWKDEGKPPTFLLSVYDAEEYAGAGLEFTPEELDTLLEQLQKAKELLLLELD